MKSKLSVLSCLVLVCAWAAPTQAELVVDLQSASDWVDGNSNLDRGDTVTTGEWGGDGGTGDSRMLVPFDTGTSMSASVMSGIQSGSFYGGYRSTVYDIGDSTMWRQNRVSNSDPDRVDMGGNTNGYGGWDYQAAIAWLKADFLGSMGGAQVDLTSDTALTLDVAAQLFGDLTIHWLVQKGGNWYVSEESNVVASGSRETLTSVALTTTQWAQIDLASGFDSAPGAFGAMSPTELDAVGFYATGSPRRMSLYAFSADVVPEPTTMAVLGLGVIGLIKRRR